MNTEEINRLLFADQQIKDIFCGCYAKDDILNQFHEKYPKAYIVNTLDRFNPGEHWVAMYFESSFTGTYFDSYGISPMHREFAMFMSRNTAKWDCNQVMIPDFFSTNCGKFCIYFIRQHSKNVSLHDLANVFSNDLNINDVLIKQLLE